MVYPDCTPSSSYKSQAVLAGDILLQHNSVPKPSIANSGGALLIKTSLSSHVSFSLQYWCKIWKFIPSKIIKMKLKFFLSLVSIQQRSPRFSLSSAVKGQFCPWQMISSSDQNIQYRETLKYFIFQLKN